MATSKQNSDFLKCFAKYLLYEEMEIFCEPEYGKNGLVCQ